MQTMHYRRWAPQNSPVRIEFPPDLLREIRSETTQDHDRGYLFGVRRGDDVRALAARRAPLESDQGLSGMEPVGVYISRVRGEVFLTDSDVEQMERLDAKIALVVTGNRAGFFVRESDGTLQTVRSHEEFWVADATPRPQGLKRLSVSRVFGPHPWIPPIHPRRILLAVIALTAVPVVGFQYLSGLLQQPPLNLAVREMAGQLIVTWDQGATQSGARLEITDRMGRNVVVIPAGSTSTTYAHHNGDVEVRLSTEAGTGMALWKAPKIFSRPFDQRASMR